MRTSPSVGIGFDTELLVIGLEGEVTDRGRYVVGRWPQLPSYRGGNLLVFRESPRSDSHREWDRWFADEFERFRIRHRSFGWSVRQNGWGEIQAFIDAGYRREHTRVFAGEHVEGSDHAHRGVRVRPIETDEAWSAAVSNQRHVFGPRPSEEESRFVRSRAARYRALAESGHGRWFGAYLDEELVASCGAYWGTDGVARFQSVVTAPRVRRQGVATALVGDSARHLLEERGNPRVVICADAGSGAERIYRSLGLALVDEMGSLLAPG